MSLQMLLILVKKVMQIVTLIMTWMMKTWTPARNYLMPNSSYRMMELEPSEEDFRESTPHMEKKFLVFGSCLFELLKRCPECGAVIIKQKNKTSWKPIISSSYTLNQMLTIHGRLRAIGKLTHLPPSQWLTLNGMGDAIALDIVPSMVLIH